MLNFSSSTKRGNRLENNITRLFGRRRSLRATRLATGGSIALREFFAR